MTLRFLPEQIEQWPAARLKPYAKNARTHSDDQIARIAASLIEFGWTAPVMVADDGEIVAGHGRLLAAQHLGLNEVPIIRLSHLTPEQVRAYRIADNRLSELSGWDDELLAAELHALNATGFDLALTGFEGEDLDRLLAPLDEGDGLIGEDARAAGESGVARRRSVAVGRAPPAVRGQHQGRRRHPRHAQP
jgi:ParB-like chromosome segregation protein Spo0J